jgi:hypothetical protein
MRIDGKKLEELLEGIDDFWIHDIESKIDDIITFEEGKDGDERKRYTELLSFNLDNYRLNENIRYIISKFGNKDNNKYRIRKRKSSQPSKRLKDNALIVFREFVGYNLLDSQFYSSDFLSEYTPGGSILIRENLAGFFFGYFCKLLEYQPKVKVKEQTIHFRQHFWPFLLEPNKERLLVAYNVIRNSTYLLSLEPKEGIKKSRRTIKRYLRLSSEPSVDRFFCDIIEDRYGRRPLMLAGSTLEILTYYKTLDEETKLERNPGKDSFRTPIIDEKAAISELIRQTDENTKILKYSKDPFFKLELRNSYAKDADDILSVLISNLEYDTSSIFAGGDYQKEKKLAKESYDALILLDRKKTIALEDKLRYALLFYVKPTFTLKELVENRESKSSLRLTYIEKLNELVTDRLSKRSSGKMSERKIEETDYLKALKLKLTEIENGLNLKSIIHLPKLVEFSLAETFIDNIASEAGTCFEGGEGEKNKKDFSLIYELDPMTRIIGIYFNFGNNRPRLQIGKAITYIAKDTQTNKKILIVEGAVINETYRTLCNSLKEGTFEAIEECAKREGIDTILFNTSISRSHQTAIEFLDYFASRSGLKKGESLDSLKEDSDYFVDRKKPNKFKIVFKNGTLDENGFKYTHSIEKKALPASIVKKIRKDTVYDYKGEGLFESLQPWYKHLELSSHPEWNNGCGHINAFEYKVRASAQ